MPNSELALGWLSRFYYQRPVVSKFTDEAFYITMARGQCCRPITFVIQSWRWSLNSRKWCKWSVTVCVWGLIDRAVNSFKSDWELVLKLRVDTLIIVLLITEFWRLTATICVMLSSCLFERFLCNNIARWQCCNVDNFKAVDFKTVEDHEILYVRIWRLKQMG